MTTIPVYTVDEVTQRSARSQQRREDASVRTYAVTGKTNAVLQFLNNPDDQPKSDWVVYDEVRAFKGLYGGHRMPPGLAVFPVTGYDDKILDLVVPDDDKPRAEPAKVMAINAIFVSGVMGEKNADYEPLPGQHIIVKFTYSKGKALKEVFDFRKDEDDQFDATLWAWSINFEDAGKTSASLKVRRRDQEFPPDSIDPVNIHTMINGVRARVDEFVAEVEASLDAESPVSSPAAVEDPFLDASSVDDFEREIAALTSADMLAKDPVVATDPFAGVSDARLKKAIGAAGGVVPRGASREILINLADSAGITSADDLS